jgi:hypothetical protein
MLRLNIAVFVALALGSAPAQAPAAIQVDRGIAGARIENTVPQVRAALGRPASVHRGRYANFGPWMEYRYAGGLRVRFFRSNGHYWVHQVSVSGPTDRTAKGVGVGSTADEVKAGVAHLTCDATSCYTTNPKTTPVITIFALRDDRVSKVVVAYILD